MDSELYRKERFIKVSNNLIFVSRGELNMGVKPLVDTINYRVAYIISYIRANEKPFFGYSDFTLEELIISCGLKPNANKGKSNDIFKNILLKLIDLNIIEEVDNSIVNANSKSKIKCRLIKEQKEGWFKVEPNEFISIMNYGGKVDRMKLFNVFLCIKSTINPNTYNYSFVPKSHIMECIGIDKRALNNYLDILQELGVLYNGYVCDTVRNNEIKSRYVYATSEELLNQAIFKSKEYYIGHGYAVQTPNTILTNIANNIFSGVDEERSTTTIEVEAVVEEEISDNDTDYSFLENKEDSWVDDMFGDDEEVEIEVELTEEERQSKICECFGVKVPTIEHIKVDKKAIEEEIAELKVELKHTNKNSIAYPFKKQRLQTLLSQIEEA